MTPAPTPYAVHTLTPVILVDRIEPCLSFWIDRLGFAKVAEVPSPSGGLQFAMLARDDRQVMYQTWASVAEENPVLARDPRGNSIALFIVVSDLDEVDEALKGVPRLVERHHTFYGMDEFTVREPGGNLVTFAMRVG